MSKPICKHCINSCKEQQHSKNCKFTTFSIDNARKELNSLLVSGENNKRLEELKKRLDIFDFGLC